MIATTLGKEFDNLMKTTCIERQTHSNQMMESWLATMKEKHDYHVRKEFEDAQKKAERERQREREKERRRLSRPNRGTRRSGGGRGRGEDEDHADTWFSTGKPFSVSRVRHDTR